MNAMTERMKTLRACALLMLTAIIWGFAMAAQQKAAQYLGPFTCNALRFLVGALTLLPFMLRQNQKNNTPLSKSDVRFGLIVAIFLFSAALCQQTGVSETGAGKAGFITAQYIVLVPVLGIFWRKRVGLLVWAAVALSVAGLYLLCMQGIFAIDPGDGMLLLCAAAYSGHILVVDYFSRRTDCVKLSCLQFAVTAAICLLCTMLFETPTWAAIRACAIPILYAGVLSGAAGYTLQILGQRDAEPTIASLLMSLESVFAVLAGWVLLGDALSVRELFGCVLMMGGIVLAQLPDRK